MSNSEKCYTKGNKSEVGECVSGGGEWMMLF